jgi:hypothetical protein
VNNVDALGCGGPGHPDPVALWETVRKRKHALDLGNAVMPSHGAQMKMCTTEEEVAANLQPANHVYRTKEGCYLCTIVCAGIPTLETVPIVHIVYPMTLEMTLSLWS